MPRDKLPLSFVIPKLVRRMAKLLPCSHDTRALPTPGLEEGEGLWGNLCYPAAPRLGGGEGKGRSFPGGDGAGTQAPPLSCGLSLGKKDTNKEMKQTASWILFLSLGRVFFLLIFLEAKEGISKPCSYSLCKVL